MWNLWYHLELLVWWLKWLVLYNIVTLVIASFTTLERTWWVLVATIFNLLTKSFHWLGLSVTWYILDYSHGWLFVREDLAIKTSLAVLHILHCQRLYILLLKRGQMILKGYLLRSSSLIQLWLLKILRVRTLEVQAVHGVFMTRITILTLLLFSAKEFLTAAD